MIKGGIVVSAVACDFIAYEGWLFETLVNRRQFHFSYNKSQVVAKKLVNLKDMVANRHEIANLVYHTWLTETEQLLRLVGGNLLLKLIAAKSLVERRSLYGEESLATAESPPHGTPTVATNKKKINKS